MKTIAKTPTANKYFSLIFPNILYKIVLCSISFFYKLIPNCQKYCNDSVLCFSFLGFFFPHLISLLICTQNSLNWFVLSFCFKLLTFLLFCINVNDVSLFFKSLFFVHLKYQNSTNNSVCCLNDEWILSYGLSSIYIQNFDGRNWFAKLVRIHVGLFTFTFTYGVVVVVVVVVFFSVVFDVILIWFWLCAFHSLFCWKLWTTENEVYGVLKNGFVCYSLFFSDVFSFDSHSHSQSFSHYYFNVLSS